MYSKHIGFSISTASRPASNIKNTSVFQYPVLRGRPRTLKTYSFSQYPAPRGRPRDLKTHWIFNIRCFEAGLEQQNILVFAISNVSRPASNIKNILVSISSASRPYSESKKHIGLARELRDRCEELVRRGGERLPK